MASHSSIEILGALLTVGVAILATAVIAFGFLAPERMLDTVGVIGFGVAVVAMVGCAIVANLYDLRGILAESFG
jgi:hypothetical protein